MSTPRKSNAHGINLAVAQELTSARVAAGVTEEALAAALPFSLRSLQRYLKGESSIDVKVLSEICAVLGVSEVDIVKKAQQQTRPSRPAKGATPRTARIVARDKDASA